ncbi:MAG: preprotein translocase subunit SecE [Patescibacteria group bacterium]
MFQKVIEYARSTRVEMEKVTWPTRNGIIRDTVLVVVISLGLAVFLGGLDYFFQFLLKIKFYF